MRTKKLPLPIFLLLIAVPGVRVQGATPDKVVITRFAGMPGPNTSKGTPKETVLSGKDFAKIEKPVAALVARMDPQDPWTADVGPDAPAMRAEIFYRGKRYQLTSWYPIYRDDPTVAVSAERGLVHVKDAKEKARIEAQNNEDYQKMMAFWNAVLRATKLP